MKKFLILFSILFICVSLFVVPSFASPSPSVISYPFVAVQPYQVQLFLSEYNTTPFPVVYYSDYASFIYSNYNDEPSVSFLVFTLDYSLNYVNPGSWKILSYNGSSNVASTSAYGRSIDISGSALTNGSTYFSFRFYTPNPDVAYFALIPLDNDESEVATNMENLVDGWYSGWLNGTRIINNNLWDHAFAIGKGEGLSEGFIAGVESVDSNTLSTSLNSFVLSSLTSPFRAIMTALNFEVGPFNLWAIFSFLVTTVVLVYVIKKLVR